MAISFPPSFLSPSLSFALPPFPSLSQHWKRRYPCSQCLQINNGTSFSTFYSIQQLLLYSSLVCYHRDHPLQPLPLRSEKMFSYEKHMAWCWPHSFCVLWNITVACLYFIIQDIHSEKTQVLPELVVMRYHLSHDEIHTFNRHTSYTPTNCTYCTYLISAALQHNSTE